MYRKEFFKLKQERNFTASEVFQYAISGKLIYDESRDLICLGKHVLIENDSAGAGIAQDERGNNHKSFDVITQSTVIKKFFDINVICKTDAVLMFYGHEPYPVSEAELDEASLLVKVNGKIFSLKANIPLFPERSRKKRAYWYYIALPANLLVDGENTVELRSRSGKYPWKVYLSEYSNYKNGSDTDYDLPLKKSWKSADNGQTWSENLGEEGNLRGEYNIRLNLNQYHSEGFLTSEVIDLADLENKPDSIAPFIQPQGPVEILPDMFLPDGTNIRIEYRCGNSLKVLPNRWSEWNELKIPSALSNISGRFMQLKFCFLTKYPDLSPVLRGVKICAEALTLKIRNNYHLTDCKNEKILRSSFDFKYEKYDAPKLVEFRKEYNLDAVTRNCNTEFEKILALAAWTSEQYIRKDLSWRSGYHFPEWNAIKILENGQGWFCLQHAIVMLQACLSLGIQARIVTMNPAAESGHEVVEIWSNEHKKWIFIDPGYNYFAYDKKSKIPLSLLELQKLLRKSQNPELMFEVVPGQGKIPLEVSIDNSHEATYEYSVAPSPMNNLKGYDKFSEKHESFLHFLRWMPRNNFLSEQYPLPLNHGTSRWPWDGYLNWCDEGTPALPQYSRFSARLSDAYWSVNVVKFRLQEGVCDNTIIVQLDSETPNMKSFMVCFDNGEWQNCIETFTWKLHTGKNKMEICTETTLGTRGPVVYAVLDIQ